MPFDLKNDDITYQRLMNAIISHQIEWNVKIYVDDMIVKTIEENNHAEYLEDVLHSVRKCNIAWIPQSASSEFKLENS